MREDCVRLGRGDLRNYRMACDSNRMTLITSLSVADRVRGVLHERKVSQEALSKILHISPMAVSRRLTNEVQWTPQELLDVADVFGVGVDYFFQGVTAESNRDALRSAAQKKNRRSVELEKVPA